VAPASISASIAPVSPFAALLKGWRQRRRRSQLALALTSGVSQRHLSFLESGRARPSRDMVLQLSEALDVPLRERNEWLNAAGFAAAFQARALDDPAMASVIGIVRMMLTTHDPYPAVAMDRAWNLRLTNASFDRLLAMLGDDLWARLGGDMRNIMRLFFHPEGVRRIVTNWATIAPLLWHRARREAEAIGGADMRAVLEELLPYQSAQTVALAGDTGLIPVLPLELELLGVRLSLLTVISTFGTPMDVTADELRVECFYPANAATEAVLTAMAG
jgi:transcriptional regulator with XRE-family HTH domain